MVGIIVGLLDGGVDTVTVGIIIVSWIEGAIEERTLGLAVGDIVAIVENVVASSTVGQLKYSGIVIVESLLLRRQTSCWIQLYASETRAYTPG